VFGTEADFELYQSTNYCIPRERMSEDKLMRHQHREKMLRNRIDRVRKHPGKKEYRKELHKREDTLKNTTVFLEELASEENRSKGLSLESRDGYINRLILLHTSSSSTSHPPHLILHISSSASHPPHLILHTSGCLVLRYGRGCSLFEWNRYYVPLFSLQFLLLPPLPPALPHYCSHH
jgi:hypothetical protein